MVSIIVKTIKKFGKIAKRFFVGIFLVVYVVVALLNYTLVQSVAGSVVSDYFSREWGGRVKVGSIGCNPFNHLVLRNVELVTPTDDTVCMASKMVFRFNKFPYDKHGLTFSYVKLQDTYYHLAIDTNGLNLNFIIDHYASTDTTEDETDHEEVEFKVLVDDLVLDNVCYRQDLKDMRPEEERIGQNGVDVKHMEYDKIKARFRNVRVDKDFVTCRIDRLTTVERSGLEVKEMHMNVYATRCGISATNMHVETADSRLMGDVLLDFGSWATMSHFLDSVVFTCNFTEGSYGNIRDAAYWAHGLWGMDERVYIRGSFGGPIADFHADNVHLAFGKESELDLDAYIYGLPHIDTTIIGAEVHNLHTTYEDLASVRHPNGIKMKAENIVRKLDYIDLDAAFTGTIYDFFASVDMKSRPGALSGDVVMSMDPKRKRYRYVGSARSDGFYLGRIAPNEWVSRTGFEMTVEGEGLDPKTMNATLEGHLAHTVLKGQRLTGETAIDVDAANGKIVADVNLDDEMGRVDLHGEVEWRNDSPVYRAQLAAENIDIKRLGLWKDTADQQAWLNARISGRYGSRSEGNAHARIEAEDVSLNTSTRSCRLHSAVLSAREQNHWKSLTLKSDIVDAQMTGYFKYDALGNIMARMMRYAPSLSDGQETKYTQTEGIADARFDFSAEINDTIGFLNAFVPKLYIAPGTTVLANYNFIESLKPILRSDSMAWGDLRIYNVGLNGEGVGDLYRLRLTSDEMKLGNLMLSENSDFSIETSGRQASCRLYWENSSQSVGGGDLNMRLVADSSRISLLVDPSRLAFGGKEWMAASTGENYLTKKGVNIDGIGLISSAQRLWVTASRMGEYDDSIQLQFSDFALSAINTFIGRSGITVDGQADGDVRIGYIDMRGMQMPYLNADLEIKELMVGEESLGDASVSSTWNADMNQLNLYVNTLAANGRHPMQLNGYMTMGGESPALDFTASIDHVNLSVIEPLVSSFSSEVNGTASVDVDITGTLEKPDFDGYVSIEGGKIKVDMLNVSYLLSDTVHTRPGAFELQNLVVFDEQGNRAMVDGQITHNHLKDIKVDLNMSSDKLLCMNTKASMNSTYYGKVIAAVDGSVKGALDNLDVVLNARTLDGSMLHVPINDKRQVKEANYIQFVSDGYAIPSSVQPPVYDMFASSKTSTGTSEMPRTNTIAKPNSVALTINVQTTPEMQLHLPMDFSTVEADVKVRGGGDLQLLVGSNQPFTIIGDYEISGGTLALDLLGVLSKDFTVDEGSSITFPGSVTDALFDINAVYSQRVNMSTLTGALSSTESQKAITVENVIALSGTLSSPTIGFDLRLPGADQSVQEEVFAYIDRNNERDMLNQTVSLLLSKRFYNMSANVNEPTSSNAASEAYGIVANTLGSVVSDMVDFVDVGFAYQAGNELWNEQYALDISKQWNKFYFESTFGFGGESREISSEQGSNNMTGDMLVGYKINPQLHLFVFNRSNTNDYTRSDLPYKQGLGLKYTRDFDTFKELFKRSKKNR